jgi:hypothetical protein
MIRRCRLALRRIEGDPKAQYRLHRFMARAWACNAVAVVLFYFLAPAAWARGSILYLALISIYANWTGDQGACAAADAATDEAITEHAIKAGETEG